MLGFLYQRNKMYEEAIIEYKKSIKFVPIPFYLASVYIEIGRIRDAIDLYNKAIESNSDNVGYFIESSFMLSRIGSIHKARANALKVPRKYMWEPMLSLLDFYLGEISATAMEESLKDAFVEIGDKKELTVKLNYFLGMMYLHNLGRKSQRDTTKAITHLKKYLERSFISFSSYRDGVVRYELKHLQGYQNKMRN